MRLLSGKLANFGRLNLTLSLQDNTVLPSRYVFVLHSNSGHILRVAPFNHALTSYTLS